jgi:hypothetical protein
LFQIIVIRSGLSMLASFAAGRASGISPLYGQLRHWPLLGRCGALHVPLLACCWGIAQLVESVCVDEGLSGVSRGTLMCNCLIFIHTTSLHLSYWCSHARPDRSCRHDIVLYDNREVNILASNKSRRPMLCLATSHSHRSHTCARLQAAAGGLHHAAVLQSRHLRHPWLAVARGAIWLDDDCGVSFCTQQSV